jgi:hypothetical protein
MKILKFEHENGWKTRIIYRKSMKDLIIEQKHNKNKIFRQIYLFDEKREVIKELRDFLTKVEQ